MIMELDCVHEIIRLYQLSFYCDKKKKFAQWISLYCDTVMSRMGDWVGGPPQRTLFYCVDKEIRKMGQRTSKYCDAMSRLG